MAFSIPPGYRRTAPVKRPKLDGFTEIIDAWLEGDKDVHRKQHHTAKRVFDRLRAEHGFTGGYTIIKDGGRGPPPVQGQGRRFGSANGGAGRCSFRWPTHQDMHRLISAKPPSSSMVLSRRPISSSWTCRTATPVSCGLILRRRRRRGWTATFMPLPSSAGCRCRYFMTTTAAWSPRSCQTGHASAHRCSAPCSRITCSGIATVGRAKATTKAASRGLLALPGGTTWCRSHAVPVGRRSMPTSKPSAARARTTPCAATRKRSANGWNAIWPQ